MKLVVSLGKLLWLDNAKKENSRVQLYEKLFCLIWKNDKKGLWKVLNSLKKKNQLQKRWLDSNNVDQFEKNFSHKIPKLSWTLYFFKTQKFSIDMKKYYMQFVFILFERLRENKSKGNKGNLKRRAYIQKTRLSGNNREIWTQTY